MERVEFVSREKVVGRSLYFAGVLRMFGNIFFAILSVLVSFIILSIIAAPFSMLGSATDASKEPVTVFGEETARHSFLSIPVSGVILGDGGNSPLDFFAEGVVYGYQVKERLREASKDESIQGVILEIDSPGGVIYGAQAISDGVALYKERTNKPVYALISGIAASGGYWAAVAADKVFADYGSTIGSIGVISGPFTFYDKPVAIDGGIFSGGVVTQEGIEATYITAGNSKDLGNPYRRLTANEIAVLQRGVDNEYAQFVAYVAARRNIPEEVVRNSVGALIYDNQQAIELKLIDGTLSRDGAYKALATAVEKEKSFKIIRDQAPEESFITALLGARSTVGTPSLSEKVARDRCGATKGILAYFGDVSLLCR